MYKHLKTIKMKETFIKVSSLDPDTIIMNIENETSYIGIFSYDSNKKELISSDPKVSIHFDPIHGVVRVNEI